MALEGYTSFVIEGEKGKEVYDLIMNAKAQCKNEQEIDVVTYGDSTYRLSVFTKECRSGKKEEIIVFAWYDKEGNGIFTYIDEMIYDDDILRIETSWRRGPALLFYFEDSGVIDYEGYYYFDTSEYNISGETNDKQGKYFEIVLEDEKKY